MKDLEDLEINKLVVHIATSNERFTYANRMSAELLTTNSATIQISHHWHQPLDSANLQVPLHGLVLLLDTLPILLATELKSQMQDLSEKK